MFLKKEKKYGIIDGIMFYGEGSQESKIKVVRGDDFSRKVI